MIFFFHLVLFLTQLTLDTYSNYIHFTYSLIVKAFDKKFKEEFPERWEEIQASRQECAERDRLLKKEIYKGISDLELLQREAEKTITKGNMLKRICIE